MVPQRLCASVCRLGRGYSVLEGFKEQLTALRRPWLPGMFLAKTVGAGVKGPGKRVMKSPWGTPA